MTDRELFRQAFDNLHASENTYEEVLMKIKGNRNPKESMTHRALVLALVGALTCGGTAYAVGGGLLASAFGAKGHDDIPATIVDDDKGATFTAPAMQFVEASETDVKRTLGSAVQHVDLTCEAEGYTLTIDELVVDEQGAGVASFTLTAPGSTKQFIGACDEHYPDYGYLKFEQEFSGTQLRNIVVRGASDELFDHYAVVDLTQTTDEVLHGVVYFGAMEGIPTDGMVFGLTGVSGQGVPFDEQTEALTRWEAQTDAFIPGAYASSVALDDGQGHTAYVSPIAITYAAPFGEGGDDLDSDERWVPNNTAIQLADGSVYTVEGDDVLNTYCSYYTTDGAMTLLFNRLVDPEQVTGATVNGPNGTTLVFGKEER